MQIIYSVLESVTGITIFASIFSILSIILSIFEYISVSMLLNSETVLVIRLTIKSGEISNMSHKNFTKYQNYRVGLCQEIGKIIDLDHGLIELLRPNQTKNGMILTFHIRSDATQGTQMMKLIRQEVKSGRLGNKFYKFWNSKKKELKKLRSPPAIQGIETKELKPDADLHGQSNDVAAVISIKQRMSANNVFTTVTNDHNTDTDEWGTAFETPGTVVVMHHESVSGVAQQQQQQQHQQVQPEQQVQQHKQYVEMNNMGNNAQDFVNNGNNMGNFAPGTGVAHIGAHGTKKGEGENSLPFMVSVGSQEDFRLVEGRNAQPGNKGMIDKD